MSGEPSPNRIEPPQPAIIARGPQHLFPIALLTLGMLGTTGAWLVVATLTDSRAGWMAIVAAAAAVLLLRLGHFPNGAARTCAALLATASCIATSYWLVSAEPIGAAMGQWPFVAASRMGSDFTWTLTRLGNTPLDWTCAGIALALAAWFAR